MALGSSPRRCLELCEPFMMNYSGGLIVHTKHTHRRTPNQVRCVLLGRAELFFFIRLTNRSEGTAFNLQVGPNRRLRNTNIPYNVIYLFIFFSAWWVFHQKGPLSHGMVLGMTACFRCWNFTIMYLKFTLSPTWQCVKEFYLLLSAAPST